MVNSVRLELTFHALKGTSLKACDLPLVEEFGGERKSSDVVVRDEVEGHGGTGLLWLRKLLHGLLNKWLHRLEELVTNGFRGRSTSPLHSV